MYLEAMRPPELVCVDPARIREVWPHARDKIKLAIETTALSAFEDIEDGILSGEQLLWLAWDGNEILAAAATHITKPLSKVCTLTACAGNERDRWLPLMEKIEQYAIDEGCSSMRIYGRKGWERVLTGYKAQHVILEKRLGR
jgi:hypothetical protein